MTEIWRVRVPGHTAHAIIADPNSKSVFVGDGWGVAHSALRLRRFDAQTGEELAAVRTRHQQVSALTIREDRLFAATSSRLLELRVSDLVVARQWEKVLPSDSQQLVAVGRFVVGANWRKPAVGVLDLPSGSAMRLPAGPRPLLVRHRDAVKVVDGMGGGIRSLDLAQGRLLGAEPAPPVSAVAAGAELWAVAAEDDARVSRVIRLTGDEWGATLPEPCHALACDDPGELIWCIVGDGRTVLLLVSQADRRVAAAFLAGPGRSWAYVDPASGLAVAKEAVRGTEGYRATPTATTIVGHFLVN